MARLVRKFLLVLTLCIIAETALMAGDNRPGYTLDYFLPESDSLSTPELRHRFLAANWDWSRTNLFDYYAYYYPWQTAHDTRAGRELEAFLQEKVESGIGLVKDFFAAQYFIENTGRELADLTFDPSSPPEDMEIIGLDSVAAESDASYQAFLRKVYALAPGMEAFQDLFSLSNGVCLTFHKYMKDNFFEEADVLSRIYLVRQFMADVLNYSGRYDKDEGTAFGQGALHLCKEYEKRGYCDGDCVSGLLLYMALAKEAGLNVAGGLVTKSNNGQDAGFHSCGLVELEDGRYITVDVGINAIGIRHKRIELLTREEFVLLQIGTQFPASINDELFTFLMNYPGRMPLYVWKSIIEFDAYDADAVQKTLIAAKIDLLLAAAESDPFRQDYIRTLAVDFYLDQYSYDRALTYFSDIRDCSWRPYMYLQGTIIYDRLGRDEEGLASAGQYLDHCKPYSVDNYYTHVARLFKLSNYFTDLKATIRVESVINEIALIYRAFNNYLKDYHGALSKTRTAYICREGDKVHTLYRRRTKLRPIQGFEVFVPEYSLVMVESSGSTYYYITGKFKQRIDDIVLGPGKNHYYEPDIKTDTAGTLSGWFFRQTTITRDSREYTVGFSNNKFFDLRFNKDPKGKMYVSYCFVNSPVLLHLNDEVVSVPARSVSFLPNGRLKAIGLPADYELTVATQWGEVVLHDSNGPGATDIGVDRQGRINAGSLKEPVEVNINATPYILQKSSEAGRADIGFSYTYSQECLINFACIDKELSFFVGEEERTAHANVLYFRVDGTIWKFQPDQDYVLTVPTLWGEVILGGREGSYSNAFELDGKGRIVGGTLASNLEITIADIPYKFIPHSEYGSVDIRFGWYTSGYTISSGTVGKDFRFPWKEGELRLKDGGTLFFSSNGGVYYFTPGSVGTYARGGVHSIEITFNDYIQDLMFRLHGSDLLVKTPQGVMEVAAGSYFSLHPNGILKWAPVTAGQVSLDGTTYPVSHVGFYADGLLRSVEFSGGSAYRISVPSETLPLTKCEWDTDGNLVQGKVEEGYKITVNGYTFAMNPKSDYNVGFMTGKDGGLLINRINATGEVPLDLIAGTVRTEVCPQTMYFNSHGSLTLVKKLAEPLTLHTPYGNFTFNRNSTLVVRDGRILGGGFLLEESRFDYLGRSIRLSPVSSLVISSSGLPVLFVPAEGEKFTTADGRTWTGDGKSHLCLYPSGEYFTDTQSAEVSFYSFDGVVLQRQLKSGNDSPVIVSIASLVPAEVKRNGRYYSLEPYIWTFLMD